MAKATMNEESRIMYLARALYDAVEDCNIKQVDTLLCQNKANPNILIPEEGMTPFHLAAGHENTGFGKVVTTLFLHNGGDPNVICDGGRTVLHIAVAWNRSSVVEILLKSPYLVPDLHFKDDENLTVFNYAIKFSAWESLATLQSHMNHSNNSRNSSNQVSISINQSLIKKNNSVVAYEIKTEKCIGPESTFNESHRLHTSSGYFNSGESLDTTNKSIKQDSVNQKNNLSGKSLLSSIANSLSDILERNISSDSNDTEQLDDIPLDNNSDRSIKNSISSEENDFRDLENDFKSVENISFPSDYLFEDSDFNELTDIELITEKNIGVPKGVCMDNSDWMTDISGLSSRLDSDDYFTCPDTNSDKHIINSKNINLGIESKAIKNNKSMASLNDSMRPISKISIGTNYQEFSNHYISSSEDGSSSSLTDVTDCDTDYVRQSLRKFGCPPGPLGPSTKHLYVRKLNRILKNQAEVKRENKPINMLLGNGSYSNELTKVLITDEYDTWKATLKSWNILEKEIIYNKNGTSFTYLLLDPRITRNLPSRADQINDPIEIWQTFISSIFYIGKGTKSRPNDHMNEAFSSWIETNNKEKSEKTKYILNLWKEELGAVCVQAFHHLVHKEAHIREAAMIDAIGLDKLTNEKRGTYFDNTIRWRNSDRCKLGCYLLYRAMLVFLADGERQLYPVNLT